MIFYSAVTSFFTIYVTAFFVYTNKNMYLCNKGLFDRKTLQITEFVTVAKSLPHSMRKAHKWLIYNIFLF